MTEENKIGFIQVKIFNLAGQCAGVFQSQSVHESELDIQINLTPGIYIIHIFSDQNMDTAKILVR